MADQPVPEDIAALGFEEALAELEAIVRRLEAGQGRLDEAIESYQRGSDLRRHCEAKLREARARIDRIVLEGGKAVGTAPLETE